MSLAEVHHLRLSDTKSNSWKSMASCLQKPAQRKHVPYHIFGLFKNKVITSMNAKIKPMGKDYLKRVESSPSSVDRQFTSRAFYQAQHIVFLFGETVP